MRKAGVVGSGQLALSVAWRLMEHGHPLTIWGPDAAAIAEAESEGAAPASSAAEVASASEIVFVAAESAVETERWHLGDDGVVTSLMPGAVVVDPRRPLTTFFPCSNHWDVQSFESGRPVPAQRQSCATR